MVVVRVRSRDGLERVTVSDPSRTTVGGLKFLIESQLGIPSPSQSLSLDPKLLVPNANANSNGISLLPDSSLLPSLGISHGSIVYLLHDLPERSVPRGPTSVSPAGSFGRNKMTIDDLISRQIRISRQDSPHADSISFDRSSADSFQRYVSDSLAFSIKRGAFLYGTVQPHDSAANGHSRVLVEFIYEPPQRGTEEELLLLRDADEEAAVEAIAAGLGMRRVGFVFTQAVGREKGDYTLSRRELLQAVGLHAEGGIEEWVTAIVKLEVNDEGGADVHFEAFQMSDVCVKLFKDGLFVEEVEEGADPKVSMMKKDVVVGVKDTKEVDNDFFLVLVKISDHQGLLSTTFPVENRITTVTPRQLKAHLERNRSLPFVKRISDFHLLLFLSKYLDVNSDIPALTECVLAQQTVPEGYQLLIESLASSS